MVSIKEAKAQDQVKLQQRGGEMKRHKNRKGAALLMSMIVLTILSTWAVAIYSISGTNVQLAENQCKADGARAAAESGVEVMRYWLSDFWVSGDQSASVVFGLLPNFLNGRPQISPSSYSSSAINIPAVTLNSVTGQNFSVQITQPPDSTTIRVDVTGRYGSASRRISFACEVHGRADNAFDYGVATKGPLSLAGNILLDGVSISLESDVYIESENSILALSITGNSQIAGDVHIGNSLATVDLQGGKAGIGGETGAAAIDNHVSFGVAPTDFPSPNPEHFEHYVTNVIDSSTDTSSDATYENVRIAAGTNPNFSGQVELRGIVFVETPNVVTFSGGSTITGIIVGDGNLDDDSGTNQINFVGNVDSRPVSDLPEEPQFAGIRDEQGTFLIAPGFLCTFGGSFNTLNGAIAGNGIEFYGNAGGTVAGSILNYADRDMTLSGNSDLLFNRSGTVEIPAGFVPETVLTYDPNSYSEIVL